MDWANAVREVVDEARRSAGSGPALAAQLEEVGVPVKGGRYSDSGITNWIKGRTSPDSSVLLAIASVAGISLDERIALVRSGKTAGSKDAEIEEGLSDLRREAEDLRQHVERLDAALEKIETGGTELREMVGLLQAQLMDLSARIGDTASDEPGQYQRPRSTERRRAANG